MDNSQKMKKKYQKPRFEVLNPQPLPRDPLMLNGTLIDLTVPKDVARAHYSGSGKLCQNKPTINLNFSKEIRNHEK